MGFELVGSLVLEGGVLAVGVVVAVDEIEDFDVGVGAVLENPALEHFELESADEGFRPSVVIGVRTSRHALAQASGGQHLAKGRAAVLAAPITMEDRAAA